MAATVQHLRTVADAHAQAALRACHEFRSKHGHRNALLDKRYELAERVMDAIDEYQTADELVRLDTLLEAAPSVDEREAWEAANEAWEAERLGSGVFFDVPLALVPRTEDAGDHFVHGAA